MAGNLHSDTANAGTSPDSTDLSTKLSSVDFSAPQAVTQAPQTDLPRTAGSEPTTADVIAAAGRSLECSAAAVLSLDQLCASLASGVVKEQEAGVARFLLAVFPAAAALPAGKSPGSSLPGVQ